MENQIKLSPVDKFHLKQLAESIKYLNNSESAKLWLSHNDHKFLIQIFKIGDENLEKISTIV